MTESVAPAYLMEMQARCLFDSVEFVFKSGLVSANVSSNVVESVMMQRAKNLFCMREYYHAYTVLGCPNYGSEGLCYLFCTCCSGEVVFLRNYSLYILATIKQEMDVDLYLQRTLVKDSELENGIGKSRRLQGKDRSFFDEDVFDDPYLVFMLLISKKVFLSEKIQQKMLLHLIDALPYFWEPYKLLANLCNVANVADLVKRVPCKLMSQLFMLYTGSQKSVLSPKLQEFIDTADKTSPGLSTSFARSMIATVHGHYKQYTKALRIFEEIISLGNCRDGLDQYTNILYSLKDVNTLSSFLLIVYDRYYNLPLYHFVSGNLLSLKSNHVGSIEQFQKILHEVHPGEFDIAYVFVAQEYFHMKDTCSSIKACNIAIKKNYNDYRVWSNMAQIYFAVEMFEYALHFFRKCAELSPTNPSVYEGLGQCFERLERTTEAIRCYKKGIENHSSKCIALLGDMLFKAKNPDYQVYYAQYLDLCLATPKSKLEYDFLCLETAERFIDALEPTAGSVRIAQWKKCYNLFTPDSNE
ncbi:anaphase-promoting complex subunit 8 [Nematocida homosporus]|uniref:anaphase-promoting complex subunit 8 n=1 Tax=Nematocida homosporus TaxID=1912981 RepID=UPI00221FEFDC|nr:anaphase-promoting complex subunit 8 [Nematocida homosporus]KAI5186978.1 anaphase-promoting complex subunit 8 [Nematocida homosporus]